MWFCEGREVMKEAKKVQQMGNALTIYLPRKWSDANGVSKGSTVFVSESSDGALCVAAKKSDEKVRASVVASDKPEALHSVISAYICGADEITIRGKQAFSVASEARNKLSAIELFDEPDGSILLRVVLEAAEVAPEELLRRMYNASKSMRDYVLSALQSKAKIDEAEVSKRDDTVDRLYLLLLRQTYKSKNSFESVTDSLLAKYAERVCSHLSEIGYDCARRPDAHRDICAYEDAFALYEKAMRRLWALEFSFDVFDSRDRLRKEVDKVLSSRVGVGQSHYLRHCMRIADYACDVSEITSDKIQRRTLSAK